MPVRNLQILFLTSIVCVACYMQAQRMKYGGKIGSAIQLIEDNFVEEVDSKELYYAAMDGVVSKLDRFSEFIAPDKYDHFQSVIEQEFGGLGILVEGPPAVEQLTVVTPIPGTPAFKAGMQPGDVITFIAENSTEGLTASDATDLMRGPVGKAVELTVRRDSGSLKMNIERADIQVASIYGDRIEADSSWNYLLEEDERIAYLRITLFGEKTVDEFKQVLDQIRGKAKAIVVDLRDNPGGILPGAVEMCDMLLDSGTIVSTRGRREIFREDFNARPGVSLEANIPMVVLVNGDSASASEIMAGCLQDAGRAKIAGSRSYGKGTVQQVFPLVGENSALKFTTARFYRPSGKNIHRTEEMTEEDEWGVTPEPELTLEVPDLQRLYFARRLRSRGDPRLMSSQDKPPAPECAGDPQLELVLEYLRDVLDGSGTKAKTQGELEAVEMQEAA